MNLSRRTFFTGLAAGGASLILPPTLIENAEAARRVWALDSTMAPDTDLFARWVEAHERREWYLAPMAFTEDEPGSTMYRVDLVSGIVSWERA